MRAKTLSLAALLIALPALAQTPAFTLQQALSAPFTIDLHAAPSGNRFVWVSNSNGARNLWLSEPGDPSASGFDSHQITHYTGDDGQDILDPAFTPDAASIVYVRGSNAASGDHPVPNPAELPNGAKQQLWIIPAPGLGSGFGTPPPAEPRLLGEGHAFTIAPDGKSIAYTLHGNIYTVSLTDPKPTPKQLIVTRGSSSSLSWSPDGRMLAFVSNRGDHSFIAVYTLATQATQYLDPSTDEDSEPIWSPDSTRVAFLRQASELEENFHGARATALPWSTRISDLASGKTSEIFRAHEGPGSAYRETASPGTQLHWVAGNNIVFPWEGDGWLHLYSVPATGGTPQLLTPGNYEVEHVDLSADRKVMVFDSNQADTDPLDIDRRHVWQLSFTSPTPKPARLTSGDGIETRPTLASDNKTVVVIRSDAHLPVRPALVLSPTHLEDLAPQAIPADFAGSKFVVPQQVIFNSTDNLKIHAQLFMPAHLGPGRHPAIVFYHGGSQRQMVLGWHYMEYYSNAYAMNQYLTSLGYIVLSINYRSGIGYGLSFREYPGLGATGAKEYDDAIAAAHYLQSRPDVDPKRIGCWGGSWGGYLTALSLARNSDLFAAGVDMEGVHNWNLDITFPPHYDEDKRRKLEALYFASSPMSSVSTWKSPVLLIHGDDDRNVPFTQSVQLVEALRHQKVETEQLIFPDEIHDLLLRSSWLRSYQSAADFFQKKLPLTATK